MGQPSSCRCLETHAAPNSESQSPATPEGVNCPREQGLICWPYCYTVLFNNDDGHCLTIIFKTDVLKQYPTFPVHQGILLQLGQESHNGDYTTSETLHQNDIAQVSTYEVASRIWQLVHSWCDMSWQFGISRPWRLLV